MITAYSRGIGIDQRLKMARQQPAVAAVRVPVILEVPLLIWNLFQGWLRLLQVAALPFQFVPNHFTACSLFAMPS